MSLFGRALAGFGQGASQLASKYIDEDLANKRAAFMADLQHQNMVKADEYSNSATRRGLLRDQAGLDTAAQGVAQDAATLRRLSDVPLTEATRAKTAGDTEAAATTQRSVELARMNDVSLMQAGRDKAKADALAASATETEAVKLRAADPEYLKAQKTLALADPKVAQAIEASRASAASAFAAAAQHNATTDGIKAVNADRKRLNDLYDTAQVVLADKSLADDERKQKMGSLMQQAALIKSKNAAPGGRDPELDTQTVTEEKMNPDGTTIKTVRKEVRRPGEERAQAEDPMKAAMDAARAKSGGVKAVPTRRDPISGSELSEAQWDKKFGRGDFKRYSDGLPSIKAF